MAEWESRPIEELVSQVSSGGTPRAQDPRYYTESGIPFLKIDDITKSRGRFVHKAEQSITRLALEQSAAKVFPAGTVLVTMYGTMGVTKTLRSPMATNQAIAALVPPFRCDPDYLALALSFRRAGLERLAAQTTQPNISGTIIRRFQIPIPPLEEQRRIADILDTIDETTQATERVIAKRRQLCSGMVGDLIERVSDRWPTTRLSSLMSTFVDGDWIEAPFITKEGIRLIQTGNIGIGMYLDKPKSQRFISPETFDSLQCSDVYAGDLLICRLADPVGRACIVPSHVGDAITAVDCTIARVDHNKADASFLRHLMSTQWWLSRCERFAAGTTRKRISRLNLGSIEISLPDVSDQRRIAATIDDAIGVIARLEEDVAKLILIRRGLAADLLLGRVRTVAA